MTKLIKKTIGVMEDLGGLPGLMVYCIGVAVIAATTYSLLFD